MLTGCNTSEDETGIVHGPCVPRTQYSKSTDRKLVGDPQETECELLKGCLSGVSGGDFNQDFTDHGLIQFYFLKIIQVSPPQSMSSI